MPWSQRSKRKVATSSTTSVTLSTASLPGSSIRRETRSSYGNHPPVNETRPSDMNAISIRHSESRDTEQIRQIFAEPSNYAATLQLPHPSVERWEKYSSNRTEGHFSLVAC